MSNTDFDALLSAEIEPQTWHFSTQGEPCEVLLRPLDSSADRKYQTLGIGYEMKGAEVQVTDVDLAAREQFLVEHTVIGGVLRRKKRVRNGDGPNDTTLEETPITSGAWMVKQKWTPAFWTALVRECERVNGYDAVTQGN